MCIRHVACNILTGITKILDNLLEPGTADARTWDTDLKYGTVPEKCGTAGNCEHVFCSDDVAKATEARLSLGGRRLLVDAAERRVLKKQKFASKSNSSVADANS